jgi:hypothetical protein
VNYESEKLLYRCRVDFFVFDYCMPRSGRRSGIFADTSNTCAHSGNYRNAPAFAYTRTSGCAAAYICAKARAITHKYTCAFARSFACSSSRSYSRFAYPDTYASARARAYSLTHASTHTGSFPHT